MAKTDRPDQHMVLMAFRAPEQLAGRVDAMAADRLSSRSETVRQLVLAGLEAQRSAGSVR